MRAIRDRTPRCSDMKRNELGPQPRLCRRRILVRVLSNSWTCRHKVPAAALVSDQRRGPSLESFAQLCLSICRFQCLEPYWNSSAKSRQHLHSRTSPSTNCQIPGHPFLRGNRNARSKTPGTSQKRQSASPGDDDSRRNTLSRIVLPKQTTIR